MQVFGNQKIVKVNKTSCNGKSKFCVFDKEAFEEASRNLSDMGAFKLYLYIASNNDSYEFALSSKHFNDTYGTGRTAYNKAVDTLISKGYLVEIEDKVFNFYDKPKEI